MPLELLEKKERIVLANIEKNRQVSDISNYSEAMRQYHNYLLPDYYKTFSTDPLYLYSFLLRIAPIKKEIVEALLLSNADPAEIYEVFGISETMLDIYKELFFDVRNIVTKLDIVEYLETYPDPAGKALKIRAFNLGPDFIYYKYGNIVPTTESQKVLVKKMFMSAAYKAMESNYSTMTSASSKAATQHATLMLKAYEAIQKLMDDKEGDGNKDLLKVLVAEDGIPEFKRATQKDIV